MKISERIRTSASQENRPKDSKALVKQLAASLKQKGGMLPLMQSPNRYVLLSEGKSSRDADGVASVVTLTRKATSDVKKQLDQMGYDYDDLTPTIGKGHFLVYIPRSS